MLEKFNLTAHNTPKTTAYVGQQFGRLTVLVIGKPVGTYRYTAVCRCECGSPNIAVRLDKLTAGHTRSCGCLHAETVTKHNCHNKPLYTVWSHMMSRCYNPRDKRFSRYGGRGIKVCTQWHTPDIFILDMAPTHAPGLQIERIDNNGNYMPENCRWATHTEQQRNRSNSVMITIAGETRSLPEWCEKFNAPYHRTRERIRAGWEPVRALTQGVSS
jgi:hypothetical protein